MDADVRDWPAGNDPRPDTRAASGPAAPIPLYCPACGDGNLGLATSERRSDERDLRGYDPHERRLVAAGPAGEDAEAPRADPASMPRPLVHCRGCGARWAWLVPITRVDIARAMGTRQRLLARSGGAGAERLADIVYRRYCTPERESLQSIGDRIGIARSTIAQNEARALRYLRSDDSRRRLAESVGQLPERLRAELAKYDTERNPATRETSGR